ncbi:unnamed protein product [Closterium sp. NIES-65]|nr:unnamed protein product [Closterium sp. NIES-65]
MTHLRTSDLCYHAALKPEFLAKNPPLKLYFLVTRLHDSLRPIRDHFLSLDPTELTLASFESRLLEGDTSAYAVAASRAGGATKVCVRRAKVVEVAAGMAVAGAVEVAVVEVVEVVVAGVVGVAGVAGVAGAGGGTSGGGGGSVM